MTSRRLWALLVVAAAVVLFPTRADAHAVLEGTTPAHGKGLSVAPTKVTLQFNERELGVDSISHVTERSDQGTSTADVEVPVAGNWELRLTVRMSTFEKPIGVTTLKVDQ